MQELDAVSIILELNRLAGLDHLSQPQQSRFGELWIHQLAEVLAHDLPGRQPESLHGGQVGHENVAIGIIQPDRLLYRIQDASQGGFISAQLFSRSHMLGDVAPDGDCADYSAVFIDGRRRDLDSHVGAVRLRDLKALSCDFFSLRGPWCRVLLYGGGLAIQLPKSDLAGDVLEIQPHRIESISTEE